MVTLSAATATSSTRAPAAPAFSHAALDTVLARHVHEGRVDYGALARDHGALDRYLQATETARPEHWPRAAQIAFWVNAYNARVLAGVIERPELESVLDVGKILGVPTLAFFRAKRFTAGEMRSLNDIEHGILRARYGEPRIHFVVNCASVSCPALPARALTAETLEATLAEATASFLTDRTKNRIDPHGILALSQIFKWYRRDFETDGDLQAWIARHWPEDAAFAPQRSIRFLPYDWSLNGTW